jgi:hypothetical protein
VVGEKVESRDVRSLPLPEEPCCLLYKCEVDCGDLLGTERVCRSAYQVDVPVPDHTIEVRMGKVRPVWLRSRGVTAPRTEESKGA